MPYGRLDNAVESLLIRDHQHDGNLRIRSFGDFEASFHRVGVMRDAFEIVRDIFTDFHPANRPVLWRMLVAQAHIYMAIVRYHHEATADRRLVVTPLPADDRYPFAWTRSPTPAQQQSIDDAFVVSEAYLKKNIPPLWTVGRSLCDEWVPIIRHNAPDLRARCYAQQDMCWLGGRK